MSKERKLKDRLGEYLDVYQIDAKLLHDKTGIAISTCYKIKSRKVTVGVINLKRIIEAYPEFSAKYLLTGS